MLQIYLVIGGEGYIIKLRLKLECVFVLQFGLSRMHTIFFLQDCEVDHILQVIHMAMHQIRKWSFLHPVERVGTHGYEFECMETVYKILLVGFGWLSSNRLCYAQTCYIFNFPVVDLCINLMRHMKYIRDNIYLRVLLIKIVVCIY